MILRSHLDCEADITIRTRDTSGRIVQEVVSHNIIINGGRKYLRDVVSCTSYGVSSLDPPPPTRTHQERASAVNAIVPRTPHRIRYVALGTGGVLQHVGAYPWAGTFTEQVTVRGLERPVAVTYREDYLANSGAPCEWQWLKQVEPQVTSEELPDDFSAVYRAFFGYSEVSFAGQPGEYGSVVPISEVLLLTSEAEAYTTAPVPVDQYVVRNKNGSTFKWPSGAESFPGSGESGVLGAIAYNLTTPINKTPNLSLEILWELRS